jgi:outer membrane protein assembly factor BamB
MGGDGPRATPTWHDGRIYALGATGELRCLDAANGQQLWRVNILEDNGAENLQWGMAAAPLVVDDKVIVLPGGTGGKSVAAYDRLSGRAVWKALDDKAAYASPMLVQLTGQRQLLVVSAERVMGVTVEEGRLLWSYPWTTQFDVNAAQPIVVDANHVFYSSGYGSGAMLLRVTREADEWKAERLWKNVEMKNRFSSSVLRDGFIYGLDEGILVCLEARSGTRKWKSGRYGHGQLLLAGDRLLLLSEQGDLVLLDATPERHAELARVPAIEGKTWNNPALAGGILLVRNAREMAAFRIAAE